MNSITYKLDDLDSLFRNKLKKLLSSGSVVLLEGEIGSGKTTFTQSYARALGIVEEIMSPTYSYVNTYILPSGFSVAHFDLYRLTSLKDFYMHGFEDFFNGSYAYCIVEWPEVANDFFKTIPHTKITLEHKDKNTRIMHIS